MGPGCPMGHRHRGTEVQLLAHNGTMITPMLSKGAHLSPHPVLMLSAALHFSSQRGCDCASSLTLLLSFSNSLIPSISEYNLSHYSSYYWDWKWLEPSLLTERLTSVCNKDSNLYALFLNPKIDSLRLLELIGHCWGTSCTRLYKVISGYKQWCSVIVFTTIISQSTFVLTDVACWISL